MNVSPRVAGEVQSVLQRVLTLNALSDERFREAATDVVVRRRAHDQYVSDESAAAALRRRVPGHPASEYDDVLASLLALYDDTVRTVKASALCSLSPDDGDAYERAWSGVADELAAAHPDLSDRSLSSTFVNWVHYWHCLR